MCVRYHYQKTIKWCLREYNKCWVCVHLYSKSRKCYKHFDKLREKYCYISYLYRFLLGCDQWAWHNGQLIYNDQKKRPYNCHAFTPGLRQMHFTDMSFLNLFCLITEINFNFKIVKIQQFSYILWHFTYCNKDILSFMFHIVIDIVFGMFRQTI